MLRTLIIWGIIGLSIGLIYSYDLPEIVLNKGKTDAATPVATPVTGEKFITSYADAVKRAAPSVVSIQAKSLIENSRPGGIDPLFERFFGKRSPHSPEFSTKSSLGSGVILTEDGLVLTNYHVIANTDQIMVNLLDGRSAYASKIGVDPETDLALLKIELKKLPAISITNSDDAEVGDVVLAIGNPYGVGQTVTQGIISATGRTHVGLNTYENFIQTDAAVNPGNSGGALINAHGDLVAINSAIYSQTGAYQGISFSIPANLAVKVMQDLAQHGQVVRGWLGVEGQDVTPELLSKVGLKDIKGVLITDVFDNGPGEDAGLMVGDIITKIDNRPITDVRDILDKIADTRPGQKISIEGVRRMQSFMAEATLIQRPSATN